MNAGESPIPGGGAPAGDPGAPAELAKVALGWLVVLVPGAWGVAQVVVRSAALFGG